jgi:hypothetical protein
MLVQLQTAYILQAIAYYHHRRRAALFGGKLLAVMVLRR